MEEKDCFYCEGLKADGSPFIYKMISYTGIAGGTGPTGSIRSKNKNVAIPRSKKAERFHRLAVLIKFLFLVLLLLILKKAPFSSTYQMLIFSAIFLLIGGTVVHLLYRIVKVKSKLFHSPKYPEVKLLEKKGYTRGSHVMISSTPLGTLVYIARWIF